MKKTHGQIRESYHEQTKGLNMEQKRNLTGWAFLLPASILIFVFCFLPHGAGADPFFPEGTGSAVQPPGLPTMHVF